jgi:hypothetical protein
VSTLFFLASPPRLVAGLDVADGEVEDLVDGVVGGELAAGLGYLVQLKLMLSIALVTAMKDGGVVEPAARRPDARVLGQA